MINAFGNDIAIILANGKIITAVYQGTKLIWQANSSCFGAGVWTNKYPWKNQDVYRNK